MELIAGDVEGLHLGLADPDALAVGARVERAVDFQAGLGRGGADQLDHGEASGERPAAPVLRDVAEQPVLPPDQVLDQVRGLCHFDVPGG